MDIKELCEQEMSKINGGITGKSGREPEEERENLIANKLAYATVNDEDILKEMKLPDFKLN